MLCKTCGILLAVLVSAASAFTPSVRTLNPASAKATRMYFFGKKDDEPLNPEPEKKASVWTASIASAPAPAAKKPPPKKKVQGGGWKARKAAKGEAIDPYSGNRGGGNYGRSDYVDVTDQDEASFLPDWLAGFFYDKSVGGPQRDLESIVATQLFFATFILTPAILGAVFYGGQ